MPVTPTPDRAWPQNLLDVLIRAGLVAVLAVACYQIFVPFLNLMLWSIILAVTLYPLHLTVRRKLGTKDGRTATLIVLVAIAILLVPIYLIGASMAAEVEHALTQVRSGNLNVPPPDPSVAQVPLIGQQLYGFWQQASTDMAGLTQQFAPQIRAVSLGILGKLAGFGLALLLFIVALMVAGIFMAYGEGGHRSAVDAASRFVGAERGPKVAALCTATIRAVAQGVIGIAFIQMILVGVGFVLWGVPGAGLLAILVLFLGILQAPAALITIPVIILMLSTREIDAWGIVLAVYLFIAGLADNVLKPLMLGRGVDVPMPVVLIGALGGMVTGGIIGLFIGPVVLGVGYQLFWEWVRTPPAADTTPDQKPVAEAAS